MTNFNKLFRENSLEELKNNSNWSSWIKNEIFLFNLITKTDFSDFNLLDKELLNNPAIFINSLEKIYNSNFNIQNSLTENISLFMYCCSIDYKFAKLFYNLLDNNHDLTTWYCSEFSTHNISQFLPKKYLSNIELARSLCSKNIENFNSFNEQIRNDINFFNQLGEDKHKIFSVAGKNVKANLNIIEEILCVQPNLYKELDKNLQKNPDFFLSLLIKLPAKFELLDYAPNEIQDNEHCVWQSVLRDPNNLSYASLRLLNSTSFALQVINSMSPQQTSINFPYWTEHIKNNTSILEEVLPKIIEAKCFLLVGENVKSNPIFMLKAILLDSEQVLNVCSKELLSSCDFIVDSYNLLKSKNKNKNSYDLNSEQNKVFNYISDQTTTNETFIGELYFKLEDIFIPIIYPKIKNHDNQTIHMLNISQRNDNFIETLKKLSLQYQLKHELMNNHNNKKKLKI